MDDYPDGEDEDMVRLQPDPITGIMPPVFGYDGAAEAELGILDYLIILIVLLIFSMLMMVEQRCCKLRLWEIAEIVILSLLGVICYFGPTFIVAIFVSGNTECDLVHMLLVQANGAALIGLAGCRVRFFCAHKSTKSGHSSLIFARLIGGIALFITLVTDQQHYSLQDYKHKLTNLHFELIILGCILWIVGNGYILWNYPRFGHFCMNSRLSMYLVIDIIATSLICFWWYGYPEYTLYNLVLPGFKPDSIHAHFLRTLACLILINVLHGVGSMRFHETLDRQGYFFSNLVVYFLVVPLVVAQQSTLKLYSTRSFVQYIMLITFMLVNCCIGYLNPGCPCACISALKDGTFNICEFDLCSSEPCDGSGKSGSDPCGGEGGGSGSGGSGSGGKSRSKSGHRSKGGKKEGRAKAAKGGCQ